jgi:hypothetical protein
MQTRDLKLGRSAVQGMTRSRSFSSGFGGYLAFRSLALFDTEVMGKYVSFGLGAMKRVFLGDKLYVSAMRYKGI